MKKSVIILAIIACSLIIYLAKASKTEDLYVKYSYFLYSKTPVPNMVSQATGFFIRRKNHLFLVTNYHAFTGKSTMDKSISRDFININFIYQSKTGNKLCTINIRDIVKKSKAYLFYEYPDLYCYDVTKNIPDNKVYSIETFIKPIHPKSESPNDIFAIGYGNSRKDLATIYMCTPTIFQQCFYAKVISNSFV
jgi:hypothetical protein